eukprot:s5077_g3.t1
MGPENIIRRRTASPTAGHPLPDFRKPSTLQATVGANDGPREHYPTSNCPPANLRTAKEAAIDRLFIARPSQGRKQKP